MLLRNWAKNFPSRYCQLLVYRMHQPSANGLHPFSQANANDILADNLERRQ
jgi:hypothetical protein